jgi:hypothetical protein
MAFSLNQMNREVDDLQQMVFRRIEIWGNNADFPQMNEFGISNESLTDYLFDKQAVLDTIGSERFQYTLLGLFVVLPIFVVACFPDSKLPWGTNTAIVAGLGGIALFGIYRLIMKTIINIRLKKMYDSKHETYIQKVLSYRL